MAKKKSPSQGKSGATRAPFGASKQSFGKNALIVRRPPRHQGR
jgi:hypothetical protein